MVTVQILRFPIARAFGHFCKGIDCMFAHGDFWHPGNGNINELTAHVPPKDIPHVITRSSPTTSSPRQTFIRVPQTSYEHIAPGRVQRLRCRPSNRRYGVVGRISRWCKSPVDLEKPIAETRVGPQHPRLRQSCVPDVHARAQGSMWLAEDHTTVMHVSRLSPKHSQMANRLGG